MKKGYHNYFSMSIKIITYLLKMSKLQPPFIKGEETLFWRFAGYETTDPRKSFRSIKEKVYAVR